MFIKIPNAPDRNGRGRFLSQQLNYRVWECFLVHTILCSSICIVQIHKIIIFPRRALFIMGNFFDESVFPIYNCRTLCYNSSYSNEFAVRFIRQQTSAALFYRNVPRCKIYCTAPRRQRVQTKIIIRNGGYINEKDKSTDCFVLHIDDLGLRQQ